MKTIQDKGTDDKSGEGNLICIKLKKILTHTWKLLDKDTHVDINKNAGRGANIILKGLLGQRKLVNKTFVRPKLREYVLENQSHVYILHNDKETNGINIFNKSIFDY